jgi:hypothetical protein
MTDAIRRQEDRYKAKINEKEEQIKATEDEMESNAIQDDQRLALIQERYEKEEDQLKMKAALMQERAEREERERAHLERLLQEKNRMIATLDEKSKNLEEREAITKRTTTELAHEVEKLKKRNRELEATSTPEDEALFARQMALVRVPSGTPSAPPVPKPAAIATAPDPQMALDLAAQRQLNQQLRETGNKEIYDRDMALYTREGQLQQLNNQWHAHDAWYREQMFTMQIMIEDLTGRLTEAQTRAPPGVEEAERIARVAITDASDNALFTALRQQEQERILNVMDAGARRTIQEGILRNEGLQKQLADLQAQHDAIKKQRETEMAAYFRKAGDTLVGTYGMIEGMSNNAKAFYVDLVEKQTREIERIRKEFEEHKKKIEEDYKKEAISTAEKCTTATALALAAMEEQERALIREAEEGPRRADRFFETESRASALQRSQLNSWFRDEEARSRAHLEQDESEWRAERFPQDPRQPNMDRRMREWRQALNEFETQAVERRVSLFVQQATPIMEAMPQGGRERILHDEHVARALMSGTELMDRETGARDRLNRQADDEHDVLMGDEYVSNVVHTIIDKVLRGSTATAGAPGPGGPDDEDDDDAGDKPNDDRDKPKDDKPESVHSSEPDAEAMDLFLGETPAAPQDSARDLFPASTAERERSPFDENMREILGFQGLPVSPIGSFHGSNVSGGSEVGTFTAAEFRRLGALAPHTPRPAAEPATPVEISTGRPVTRTYPKDMGSLPYYTPPPALEPLLLHQYKRGLTGVHNMIPPREITNEVHSAAARKTGSKTSSELDQLPVDKKVVDATLPIPRRRVKKGEITAESSFNVKGANRPGRPRDIVEIQEYNTIHHAHPARTRDFVQPVVRYHDDDLVWFTPTTKIRDSTDPTKVIIKTGQASPSITTTWGEMKNHADWTIADGSRRGERLPNVWKENDINNYGTIAKFIHLPGVRLTKELHEMFRPRQNKEGMTFTEKQAKRIKSLITDKYAGRLMGGARYVNDAIANMLSTDRKAREKAISDRKQIREQRRQEIEAEFTRKRLEADERVRIRQDEIMDNAREEELYEEMEQLNTDFTEGNEDEEATTEDRFAFQQYYTTEKARIETAIQEILTRRKSRHPETAVVTPPPLEEASSTTDLLPVPTVPEAPTVSVTVLQPRPAPKVASNWKYRASLAGDSESRAGPYGAPIVPGPNRTGQDSPPYMGTRPPTPPHVTTDGAPVATSTTDDQPRPSEQSHQVHAAMRDAALQAGVYRGNQMRNLPDSGTWAQYGRWAEEVGLDEESASDSDMETDHPPPS